MEQGKLWDWRIFGTHKVTGQVAEFVLFCTKKEMLLQAQGLANAGYTVTYCKIK